MENSFEPVDDLSKSASGTMAMSKIVYAHVLSVDKVFL